MWAACPLGRRQSLATATRIFPATLLRIGCIVIPHPDHQRFGEKTLVPVGVPGIIIECRICHGLHHDRTLKICLPAYHLPGGEQQLPCFRPRYFQRSQVFPVDVDLRTMRIDPFRSRIDLIDRYGIPGLWRWRIIDKYAFKARESCKIPTIRLCVG